MSSRQSGRIIAMPRRRCGAVRTDPKAGRVLMKRWKGIREKVERTTTPTGLTLPRLALPELDEPGAVARYLYGEGLPGEFPFINGIYREMYLDSTKGEEPMRLFAGLGLAEDTNARFHYLTAHQKSIRLSTAFDGPTLYGMDSDAAGVFGKIGEGGVAIDTIDDMERLYSGFQLGDEHLSISMTINGPAPSSWRCSSRQPGESSVRVSCRSCAARCRRMC